MSSTVGAKNSGAVPNLKILSKIGIDRKPLNIINLNLHK